jgi:hypothetical protein
MADDWDLLSPLSLQLQEEKYTEQWMWFTDDRQTMGKHYRPT